VSIGRNVVFPMTMFDCTEPGRFTRRMSVARLAGAVGVGGVAAAPPRHEPNALAASSRARGSVMSPATTSNEPPGRMRRAANATMSLRVIALYAATLVFLPYGLRP